jgi:hypothetical protein
MCLTQIIAYFSLHNIFVDLISNKYNEILLGNDIYSRADMNLPFIDLMQFS